MPGGRLGYGLQGEGGWLGSVSWVGHMGLEEAGG